MACWATERVCWDRISAIHDEAAGITGTLRGEVRIELLRRVEEELPGTARGRDRSSMPEALVPLRLLLRRVERGRVLRKEDDSC